VSDPVELEEQIIPRIFQIHQRLVRLNRLEYENQRAIYHVNKPKILVCVISFCLVTAARKNKTAFFLERTNLLKVHYRKGNHEQVEYLYRTI
jgi:hypothetical protein